MRYYVYASETKIDMLYSQIPPSVLKRFVGELKLDLKVLALSLQKRDTDETLYSKLTVVERYLREEANVGSIAEPAAWLEGRMPLRSGFWGDPTDGMFYFGGLHDGVLVALIGSAHHRIGARTDPTEVRPSGFSGLPALFSLILRDDPAAQPRHAKYDDLPTYEDDDDRHELEVVEFAFDLNSQPGVAEPTEFLARRLLDRRTEWEWGNTRVKRVLLATPLYVATQ